MKKILLSCSALALAACTVGPNYQRSQVSMPGEFRNAPAPAAGTLPDASFAGAKWKDVFADPTLNQIVSASLANNFHLRIAAERAQQARAQLGITRASQYPQLDAQAGFSGERLSSIAGNGVPAGTNLRDRKSTRLNSS